MLDVVSIGECLVEFNRRDDGSWSQGFAGDAFNALYHAGRLGLRTGFISAVGDDLFTSMITDGIEREGIDTTHLLHITGGRNGLYFIEIGEIGEYTFHFWRNGSAATETLLHQSVDTLADYISRSRYLLLSGITLAVMPPPERMIELLRRVKGRTSIVLDTNYRASLWRSVDDYRRCIEEVLPLVDIFLPTLGDLDVAWPSLSLEDLCGTFSKAGPQTIVVKMGDRGCACWHHGSLETTPAPANVTVVDTTGAGDAFNGGFLAGLTRYNSLRKAIDLAQQCAVQALAVRGALNPDFPNQQPPIA